MDEVAVRANQTSRCGLSEAAIGTLLSGIELPDPTRKRGHFTDRLGIWLAPGERADEGWVPRIEGFFSEVDRRVSGLEEVCLARLKIAECEALALAVESHALFALFACPSART